MTENVRRRLGRVLILIGVYFAVLIAVAVVWDWGSIQFLLLLLGPPSVVGIGWALMAKDRSPD